ncbi:hypothetical protein J3Q64DRAFT_1753080 [Phycomyces blakesleeanus]|uniref:Uncharacterized protein n=1 Tax=Phycomyces blakesleeanus TaxID=4837 RepID=A0ABR3AV53_PHYBL
MSFKPMDPQEPKTDETNHRIMTRRVSRSAQSRSPVLESKDGLREMDRLTPSSSPEPVAGRVATRSASTDSSLPDIAETRKRRRKTQTKKRQPAKQVRDDTDRETRHTAQRMTKEAKEAKKAQREIIIKSRLSELEKLERAVKNGSHPDYLQLLRDIEAKRDEKRHRAEARHELIEKGIRKMILAQEKIAYDQYHLDKLALRRTMIQQMQQKINTLEQEYHSRTVQGKPYFATPDVNDWLDWVPPERPSVISSLTLGLSPDCIDEDLALAHGDAVSPEPSHVLPFSLGRSSPTGRATSPIHSLASLVDRQDTHHLHPHHRYLSDSLTSTQPL